VFDSGTISAVVAVVGLLLTGVALVASYRVSKRSVSTQVYRDTAAAWEAKSKAQDIENQDLRAKLTARDSLVAELQGRVSVLQETVTGARAWDTLERRTAEMLALAAETRSETRQLHEAVDDGLAQLTSLSNDCNRVLTAVISRFGGTENRA
jgi:myo-inositol-1-phosphate synthase